MTARFYLALAITGAFLSTGPCVSGDGGSTPTAGDVQEVQTLPADLILQIAAPMAVYKEGEQIGLCVTIMNKGPKPVTLVQPGDGSDCAWRTPIIGWSIIKVEDEKTRHPDDLPLQKGITRCGNRNSLKSTEIFTVKPNEFKQLSDWVSYPHLTPGTYRLVLYYQNDPGHKNWRGLSQDDPEALREVKKTFACLLKSNEIMLTVKENPKEGK
jgi:hypothetical protein